MDEKKTVSMAAVLDGIIAKTFSRHAGLSEDEYLEKLNAKGGEEGEEVRKARMVLLYAITKEMLKATDKVEYLTATMKLVEGKNNG